MNTRFAEQRRLSEASLPWLPESAQCVRNKPRVRVPGVEEALSAMTLARHRSPARCRCAGEREFNLSPMKIAISQGNLNKAWHFGGLCGAAQNPNESKTDADSHRPVIHSRLAV